MFSQRLKQSRQMRAFTQQQIADLLDITINSYQKYEQGTRSPSFDILIKIADLYDVSIDWLLGRDEWLQSHGVSFDERL